MHYEITASVYAGKPLTVVQRTSPFFTDCPRFGNHVIRNREVLRFDEEEMRNHEAGLKRLFEAEAIEIVVVDDAGKRHNLRDIPMPAKDSEATPTPAASPVVQTAPIEEPRLDPVIEAPPVVEPAVEVVPPAAPEVVQPAETPATVESTQAPYHKGKKGRKE